MSKRIFLIQFLLLLLISIQIYPQKSLNYNNLTFEHLSIENGLSQITVHAILQDSKGFMWFGTEDGLNRYDGYNFKVFQYNQSDSNSISDNFIWSIIEDSDENLWVGTNSGGLNMYDYSTNSFVNYLNEYSGDANNIRVIFEDSYKDLWIGTNNAGLYKFSRTEGLFEKVVLSANENKTILAITEDKSGNIWIGTSNNGLFVLKGVLRETIHYSAENSNLSNNSVWSLKCDNDNNIWIGTYSGGLCVFEHHSEKIKKIKKRSGNDLINNNVTSILLDDYGNPWIATEGGLSIFNKYSGEFINYKHDLSDLRSLSNSFLRFIMKDNSDLIWIGTVGGGVNKINLNQKFNQFNHNPTDPGSLSHNMIRAIEEDSKGNMWIGTLGNGINRFNKTNNRFVRFNAQNDGLSENVITSIFEDSQLNLWIGTWGGGLNKVQFDNNNSNNPIKKIDLFNYSQLDSTSVSSNIIQDIFEDSHGNLWIGTENGLNWFNRSQNSFQRFIADQKSRNSISDNRIQSKCIIEDRLGYIWVGTWQGLNRFYAEDINGVIELSKVKKIFKADGLSDNRIISIYEDKSIIKNDSVLIWVGTIGGGLNRLSIKILNDTISECNIKSFSVADGLPSNVIYGILGDDDNNLWLSTNNGISKFNSTDKNFRNYDLMDGLQSNQFFYGAFHANRDGELYFGGINGLNSFYPDKLEENKNIPPLYFTRLIIESTDGSTNMILENIEEINKLGRIKLPYDSYDFRFEFTALDLVTPSKNMYSYILENYDEKWSNSSFLNYASYKGISDGEYKFSVLGSNNDGLWNESGASLSVIISTPFWKSWWFIVLVFFTLGAIITYLVFSQVRNILAVERVRTKLAADLHDNIGASLTEISILTEVISTRLKSEDSDVLKNLGKISTKSRNLIDKMSDIVWLVNPQRDSLYDLILRLQDTYSDLLADTDISFRSENLKSLEKVSLSMEHRQNLFLIFKEAINNSITHSNCNELFLNAHVSGKTLRMKLEDNGVGFITSEDSLGNGLKNMQNRAKKIGGKLIINSEKDKGTVINYFGYIR